MRYDDTMTDLEFRPPLSGAEEQWLASQADNDPDLSVDGLEQNPLARLLGVLLGRRGS